MKKQKYSWWFKILWLIVLYIVITTLIMRFKHPELTETELFLKTPHAIMLNFK
jgi:hypothetical protein